ncbi:MAG: methyltransferase, partial [Candidatus Omnitrophica bacterium]|nr:methyltransferase [Candidatus Omnitrophota bacterium]
RLIGHYFIAAFRRFVRAALFLYAAFWVGCIALVILNKTLLLKGQMLAPNIFIGITGAIIFSLGMFLQFSGIRTLGIRSVLGIPELKDEDKKTGLIIKGPFLLVRHPIYFGQYLWIVGLFLMTLKPSAFVLLLMVTIFLWPVTELEERELRERFKEEYQEYQKRVPRFFPKVRLKALGIFWLLIFLAGCSTVAQEGDSVKNGPENVRVSGDMTISTVDRKGF